MIPEKKKVVLYKAIELFNQFGYTNVGIDLIISESKVAKMTFYKYFPSKDLLITECLIERDLLIRDGITKAISTVEQEPLKKLKAIFNWFNGWFKQDDFFGCMFIKALGQLHMNPSALNVAKSHKQWLIDQINNILIDMNIINYDIALQIYLVLDGSIIREQQFKDNLAITYAWDMTLSIISASNEQRI